MVLVTAQRSGMSPQPWSTFRCRLTVEETFSSHVPIRREPNRTMECLSNPSAVAVYRSISSKVLCGLSLVDTFTQHGDLVAS